MESSDLVEIVEVMRVAGADLAQVEVKAAAGGLPKSLRDSLSAFSNGEGGTVILGLDERAGFTSAEGFDAGRMQAALAAACAQDLEPPVRASVEIVIFEGRPVVVAEVPELDPRYKPCFVKARGEHAGSFIRGGDGDRRLTDFEIHLLHTDRGQPHDDVEAVPGATIEDLQPERVAMLLERVRRRQPRALAGFDDRAALQRLNVLSSTEPGVPTLAGLLAFGAYPQQFFPQLDVTFVVYPAADAGAVPSDGPRFLDNRSFDGAIPDIVVDALAAFVRNMAVAARIERVGRSDVYDDPVEALREAFVNALVHRDYSTYSRGAPVQVEMYSDRMQIANPGGLYGAVSPDDLGREGVMSSRNPALIKILQDTRLPDSDQMVCENRGSGIPAMLREARRVGAPAPEFKNRLSRFTVIFHKAELLSTPVAGADAAGLSRPESAIVSALRRGGTMTRQQIEEATGLAQATVLRHLQRLADARIVHATAPSRSPHRRYRLS